MKVSQGWQRRFTVMNQQQAESPRDRRATPFALTNGTRSELLSLIVSDAQGFPMDNLTIALADDKIKPTAVGPTAVG